MGSIATSRRNLVQRDMLLPNGMPVRLLHRPDLPQCAAAVRIAAGSHDEPAAFPGLAHLLEHLLFQDTARFPARAALMPFVQAQGGEVNASTGPRETLYLFGIEPGRLADGLDRLFDMLARPCLGEDAQRREREVIDAEFQARSRDGDTLMEAALALAAEGTHPCFAFHAGHRGTLPIEREDFQQALRAFHRGFYVGPAARLVLAGPQSLEALEELAIRHGGCLEPAASLPDRRLPPLSLLPVGLHLQLEGGPRLGLFHGLDGLAPEEQTALDVLFACLQDERHGLPPALRRLGWCEDLRGRTLYRHAGQALLGFEFQLGEEGGARGAELTALLRHWLERLSAGDWQACCRERQEIAIRRRLRATALELVCETAERWPLEAAPATGGAVRRLIERLLATEPAVLLGDQGPVDALATSGFPLRARKTAPPPSRPPAVWPDLSLPSPNPFLRQPAEADGGVFLRCCGLPVLRMLGGRQGLQRALASIRQQVGEAGLALRIETAGDTLTLSLLGAAAVVPDALAAMGRRLAGLEVDDWSQGIRLARHDARMEAGQVLLRQLLQRLPAVLADEAPPRPCTSEELAQTWSGTQTGLDWQRLEVDLESGALASAVASWPGRWGALGEGARCTASVERRWQSHRHDSTDHALVLCCPPPAGPSGEAVWRLFASRLQGAFYQRLRGELQLGYAVFCGYRRWPQGAGLVFAVQSPKATPAELLNHVEAFLEARADDAGRAGPDACELARRLSASCASFASRAEDLWRQRLGEPGVAAVSQALRTLGSGELAADYTALREARHGWLALATAAPHEEGRWCVR